MSGRRTALAAAGALGGVVAVVAYNGLLSTQAPVAGRAWTLILVAAVGGLALSALGWILVLRGDQIRGAPAEGAGSRALPPVVVGVAAGFLFWARLGVVGETTLASVARAWEAALLVAAFALGAATDHWVRRAGPRLGLAGLVLVSPVLVAGVAVSPGAGQVFPLKNLTAFPGWLAGPFAGLGPTLGNDQFHSMVLVLFVAYLAVLVGPGSVGLRAGVVAVVVLHAVYMLAPPLLSGDLFSYLAYARGGALLGANPYAGGPPVSFLTKGLDVPSTYGPVFQLASYAVAPLGIPGGYWALKAAGTVGSLGALALLWRCAVVRGVEPMDAVLFAGLNPVLLVYTVGGGHNELVMLPLLVGGILLTLQGREGLGGAAAVAAAGVKLSGAIVAPFQFLGAARSWRVVAGASLAVGLIGAVSVAAFGSSALGWLGALEIVRDRGSGYSVLAEAGALVGLSAASPALAAAGTVLLGITVVVMLIRVVRGGDWVAAAGWSMLASLVASPYLMPWYVAALLPLAAVGRSDRLRWAVLALSALLLWRLPS